MKIAITIPREFRQHFVDDQFKDSLERVKFDLERNIKFGIGNMAGLYERELIEMLIKAFQECEVI